MNIFSLKFNLPEETFCIECNLREEHDCNDDFLKLKCVICGKSLKEHSNPVTHIQIKTEAILCTCCTDNLCMVVGSDCIDKMSDWYKNAVRTFLVKSLDQHIKEWGTGDIPNLLAVIPEYQRKEAVKILEERGLKYEGETNPSLHGLP